jgi:alginate O-acetyltransferase complex protein AlgJ
MIQPPPERTSRARDLLLSILLVAFISAPLLGVWTGMAPPMEGGEYRTPARRPELKPTRASVNAFPAAYERYYNDHFGFRQALVRAHSWMKYHLFDESPLSTVIKGREGWLYFAGPEEGPSPSRPLDDFRRTRPLTRRELTLWAHVREQRRAWLAARGIRYLLVLAPNKSTIYPDHMPAHIRRREDVTPFDQVMAQLRTHTKVDVIDVRPVLQAQRARRLQYLKTDTHWNAWGAFLGYQAAAGRLAAWFPEIVPFTEDQFSFCPVAGPAGDLARMIGMPDEIQDEAMTSDPHFSMAHRVLAGDSRMLPSSTALVTETGKSALPAALVFGDSFMHGLRPFLAEHLRRGVFMLGYGQFPARRIEEERPDVVIEEVVERFLRRRDVNPAGVDRDVAQRRFEASTDILFQAKAVNGFAGLTPIRDLRLDAVGRETLAVSRTGPDPRLRLPAWPAPSGAMPVLRVELHSSRRSTLRLYWRTPEKGDLPWPHTRYTAVTVRPGAQVLYVCLFDPEARPPFELAPGMDPGECEVVSIEVRACAGWPENFLLRGTEKQ